VGYVVSLGTKTYQTMSGLVAYEDPQTRRTLPLINDQAIHIPHFSHHLLCPMQCRMNDVIVNIMPFFLASDPTDQMHALVISDTNNPLRPVTLPLVMRGVLLLKVRPVTINELNSEEFPQLHLASETLTWHPSTNLYRDQEKAMTGYYGTCILCDAAVRGPALTLLINKLNTLTTGTAVM
jgi:hypothetical protein